MKIEDFQHKALRIKAGTIRHFTATDRISGWLGAWTNGSWQGQGYMPLGRVAVLGWDCLVNGRPLNRDSKSLEELVWPWGSSRLYDDCADMTLLARGRRILSLGVGPRGHLQAGALFPGTTVPPLQDGPAGSPASSPRLDFQVRWSQDWLGRRWTRGPHPDVRMCCTGLIGSILHPEGLQAAMVRTAHQGWEWLHICFGTTRAELGANISAALEPAWAETEMTRRMADLAQSEFASVEASWSTALWWARQSALGMVTEEYGPGIWAGLPWFKDNWGRDTFIALPGTLLVTGRFAEARAVLEQFARRQNQDPASPNHGRVPNRVNRHETLYNTVDGTPWLIREVDEYLRHTGDRDFALSLLPLVEAYLAGAFRYWVDSDGLLRHDHADTWMDARIEGNLPWSPRGDRAIEIQALWHQALSTGARLADMAGRPDLAASWTEAASRVATAVPRLFVADGRLVDRIAPDGTRDLRFRPNVLMLAWIPFESWLPAGLLEESFRTSLERLLLPWGILSLDPAHPLFHPRHESPVHHHKDAAYHNGTIWGWNAGFAISALCWLGQADLAWELSRNLASQILEDGTLGTMSELVDAVLTPEGRVQPTGTFSQTWSVSEFSRNAVQDFLGYRPDLARSEVVFRPCLPTAWTRLDTRVPLGPDSWIHVGLSSESLGPGTTVDTWTIALEPGTHALPDFAIVFEQMVRPGEYRRYDCPLIDGQGSLTLFRPTAPEAMRFASLGADDRAWEVLQGTDVLRTIIESGKELL